MKMPDKVEKVNFGQIGPPPIRGCPHITSAAGGGGKGVSQMLTIADEGG